MTTLDLLALVNRNVRLAAAPQKKLSDLLGKALNILVVGLPLSDAQALGSSVSAGLQAHIHTMSAADLKKLLKLWDPVRKIAKETTISEMREIAVALLTHRLRPEVKVAKAKKGKR